MNIKERILETLKKEFEPLGYRYLKSRSIFKRNVGKDIIVHLYYNASRFHREFTIVNFFYMEISETSKKFYTIKTSLTTSSIGTVALPADFHGLHPKSSNPHCGISYSATTIQRKLLKKN